MHQLDLQRLPGRHQRLALKKDGGRARREPEETILYRAVQAAWGRFVGSVEAGERSVPRFCLREVEAFLRCGVLAHG